jgi:peptide/nickel transport system substrate-binding protein
VEQGPAPTGSTTSAVSIPSNGTASTSKAGGTLNVALGDLGTDGFDVIVPVINHPSYLIFEPLLRYDQRGNIMPRLAESWSMSPDGKLWTFNLHKDVKWSNGEDFTSDDVKFTIER